MKILPDDRCVSADVAAFLTDLEFRFVPDTTETALALRVASLSTGKTALGIAVDVGWGVFYGRTYLRYYGIVDPGRPPLGAPGDVAYTGLPEIFEATLGRKMTSDESAAIAACVLAAAKDSPEVAAFVAGLDVEALGAFGRIPSSLGGGDPYTWIAGPKSEAGAMKRFVLRHPLLAGLATAGSELFEAARGALIDESYGNMIAFVVANGFPCSAADLVREGTGPVPTALLARFEGLAPPKGFQVLDEERLSHMADVVRLARRLPEKAWPDSVRGWIALGDAGEAIRMLGEREDGKRDVEAALDYGSGCALDFSDAELAAAFDPDKGRFYDLPRCDYPMTAATRLAWHGVRLAGHADWAEEASFRFTDPPSEVLAVDFSELKAAIIADGFLATLQRAAAEGAPA